MLEFGGDLILFRGTNRAFVDLLVELNYDDEVAIHELLQHSFFVLPGYLPYWLEALEWYKKGIFINALAVSNSVVNEAYCRSCSSLKSNTGNLINSHF